MLDVPVSDSAPVAAAPTPNPNAFVAMVTQTAWMLRREGQMARAAELLDQALTAETARLDLIRWQHALIHLQLGDLAKGWPGYAARHSVDPYLSARPNDLGRFARWSGQDLRGKTLLIAREQGLGDEILFSALMRDLAADPRLAAGTIFWHTEPRLAALFARSFPDVGVIPGGPDVRIAGPVDYVAAIGDLAQVYRPDMAAFARQPRAWLTPSPELRGGAEVALGRIAEGRARVGLSWRSHAPAAVPDLLLKHQAKSLSFDQVWAAVGRDDVLFVSLQYGDAAAVAAEVRGRAHVDDTLDATNDLDGLAARIAALDLVITTSNTTAHLAAALGVPTWVIVPEPYWSLWYWGLGDATPWYPSSRLFRARTGADWPHAPLADAAAALQAFVGG